MKYNIIKNWRKIVDEIVNRRKNLGDHWGNDRIKMRKNKSE